jgi:GTPase Era involved in 16S rRNA processing
MDRPKNFKLCLVLNKVDRVEPKKLLLPLAEKLDQVCEFDEVFMVSAMDNDGIDDIRVK